MTKLQRMYDEQRQTRGGPGGLPGGTGDDAMGLRLP